MGIWQSSKFAAMAGSRVTAAESLLTQYSTVDGQGLAVDFTDGTMTVRDTVTPANNFTGDFRSKFTVIGTLAPSALGVLIDASNYATLATSAFPSTGTLATILAEYYFSALTAVIQTIACIDNGLTTERLNLYISAAGNAADEMRFAGAAVVSHNNLGAYTAGTIRRTVSAFQLNNSNGAFNGVAATNDIICVMATGTTTLRLGRTSATQQMDGYLRKLVIIPARMTDAQIASMSVV